MGLEMVKPKGKTPYAGESGVDSRTFGRSKAVDGS
jgi:hypothetical protein